MNKETSDKLVQNTETRKVNPPGFFSDYKKWREDHGIDTPEVRAYRDALKIDAMVLFAVGFVLGQIAFKAFGV